MHQYLALKIIGEKFGENKTHTIWKNRRDMLGWTMVQRMKKKLKLKGETIQWRQNNDISLSLTTTKILIHDTYRERAKDIMLDFLTSCANKYDIHNQFLKFINIILSLQKSWRKYQEQKANRMKFLVFKWDYELEHMIEFCQESKLKKHKALQK